MNDFVEGNTQERSCWSVTAWALVVALGLGFVGMVVSGSERSEKVATVEISSGS